MECCPTPHFILSDCHLFFYLVQYSSSTYTFITLLAYVGTVLFSKRLSRKMFQASSRVSKRLPNVSAGFSGFQTSFSGRKKSKFQKRPLNVSQKFKKDPWTAYRPAQPSFFDIGTPRGLSARKNFLGGG